jgi:pimeloyl-ACP methyl ester carboxylesterase
METLRHNFLQVQFKTLEAGHWVHAERPEDLQTVVTEFYEEDIK